MLAQRIFGIALGYEDLNDHQSLRRDPLFQIISERGIKNDLPLASPPTLRRLENRIDRRALVEIAKVFVETFISSHRTEPDVLVLDFDPTDDPVHGNQEKRFFHGYYDNYCFLPLYVFWAVNCLLHIFDLGHRPCVAQPGDSEIIGYEVPSAVAEREDYLSW